MKHVFFIHSHTVFMTSMGIVDYLKLQDSDIVFLYSRSYRNSIFELPFTVYDMSVEADKTANANYRDRSERQKSINLIDAIIQNYIGEKYVLYIPHISIRSCQLLYTNPLCQELAYVQEGGYPNIGRFIQKLSVYDKIRNYITNKWIRRTDRVFRTVGWYQPGILTKQNSLNSYAINNEYFKYLPSINHVVKWPSHSISVDYGVSPVIFVFDCFAAYGVVAPDFYYGYCYKIIEKYASSNSWLKFHPAQGENERAKIIEICKNKGIQPKICDDSIPMELVISSLSGLTFVGASSSLLKFAIDHNHTVYANDRLLADSYGWQRYVEENQYQYMQESF